MKNDFREMHDRTKMEIAVQDQLGEIFEGSDAPIFARLQAFPAYSRRQDISRFILRHELFLKQLTTSGSIVELGVYGGGSLFSWLHFSSIYEPFNHTRKIYGFDTFSGFPAVADEDFASDRAYKDVSQEGGLYLSGSTFEELRRLSELHDQNRPVGNISKVHLIQGDVTTTVPKFVSDHRHVPLSMVYFDLDLYEPTKIGLEHLAPRVVSGGLIVFDEFGHDGFPGETLAALENLGYGKFQRSPLDPHITWIVRD